MRMGVTVGVRVRVMVMVIVSVCLGTGATAAHGEIMAWHTAGPSVGPMDYGRDHAAR